MTDVTCLPPAALYPTQLPIPCVVQCLFLSSFTIILSVEGCLVVEKLMVDGGGNKNGGGDGGDGGGSGWRTL